MDFQQFTSTPIGIHSYLRVVECNAPELAENLAALDWEGATRGHPGSNPKRTQGTTIPPMVDLNKRLSGNKSAAKPLDPEEIYESSDRAADTCPLRPAQISVLKEWFAERREAKDLIVKMHTGQGKTLIGLLILQSKMNE